MKRLIVTVLIMLLVFMLEACSTTNYQQPVSQFAKGASNVKDALNLMSTERENAVIKNMALSLQQKGVILSPPSNCPATDTPPKEAKFGQCSWTITYPNMKPLPANIKYPEKKALAFVSALNEYGQGLVEIASAQDVAELKAAVSKAGSAISNVAALATPVAPAAYPVVKTITTGSAWIFGKIADAERLETLTDMVKKGEPIIQKAIPALQSSANRLLSETLYNQKPFIKREMLEVMELHSAKGSWSDAKTASQTVINDAIAYDKTATNGIGEVLGKMKSAHTDLLKSLTNPDVSFDDAVRTTSEFAAEATTLIEIQRGK